MSDVFAFDLRSGALQEIILGISYQRMSKTALQKALERAAGKVCSKPTIVVEQSKHVEYPRPASPLKASDDNQVGPPTQTLPTIPKPSHHPDIRKAQD